MFARYVFLFFRRRCCCWLVASSDIERRYASKYCERNVPENGIGEVQTTDNLERERSIIKYWSLTLYK